MNPEVLKEARRQIGFYVQDIMKQRGMNKTELAFKSGITREQLDWVLRGERDITFNTFLKVIFALDYCFVDLFRMILNNKIETKAGNKDF